MPYPQLRTGGPKDYSAQLFDSSGNPVDYLAGTTFSAFTTDPSVATASVSADGKIVTVTPTGSFTGNVYVSLYATIPGHAADIAGTILIHVMDAALTEKEYLVLAPVS